MIALCAVLSDADNVDDFAAWARVKEEWLRRFRVLKNGIPSQDTFFRVFGALNPKQFEAVFRRWVGGLVPALSRTIAVEGKTLRGSGKGADSPVHRVSAFATDRGRVLGQEKVAGKSNEITAIPEGLQALTLKGHLVTIDAMGCQKAIAAQIVAQKGDDLLAVKGNPPTLHAAIQKAFDPLSGEQPWHEHRERSQGRGVTQFAWVAPAEGVANTTDWPACKTLGCLVSQRVVGHKGAEAEWRYTIVDALAAMSSGSTKRIPPTDAWVGNTIAHNRRNP
jgi:predicted transposase YbfD/YdcC